MGLVELGTVPIRAALRPAIATHPGTLVPLVAILLLWLLAAGGAPAELAAKKRPDPRKATTSREARESAIRSIPFEKMDRQARAKIGSVLSNISVFRRMPTRVVDCDPKLYLFLLRHPDVVVNIWEVLKVSTLKLRQVEGEKFEITEKLGTAATVEFLYSSHDTHVIYAEGAYDGPLFTKPVKGRCLMVLKSGYIREPDGRFYITSRLDAFVRVEHGGAELLTKTFHPLVGKTADMNFIQTVAFLGSLSRTAEVNSDGVQRLAGKLLNVDLQLRQRLARLADEIGRKYAVSLRHESSVKGQVVSRTTREQ